MPIACRRTALCVALSWAIAAPLAAQSPENEDPSKLDEIKVTAQRYEESLQQVPISITALGEEQFEKLQVERLDDLKKTVPNVIIEQNTGTSSGAKIFLRGVGADESLFTSDPAVGIYIDDVYIPRQTGSQIALYDIERIEVLRGPQGTLYGRNATGGAIRYITRKPDGQTSFRLDGTIGNIDRRDLRATAYLGISDAASAGFAVMTKNRGGYSDNLTTGGDVNDQEVHAMRGSLALEVSDNSKLSVALDALKERSGPGFASCVLRQPLTLARPAINGVVPAPFRYPGCDTDGDLYTLSSNIKDKNDLEQFGASAVLETEFSGATWRNILAYREMDNLLNGDFDGQNAVLLHIFQDQQQDQWSFESQLVGESESLRWVIGGFLFSESNEQPTQQSIFAPGVFEDIRQDTDAYALYGQGSYDFGEAFTFTFGGRYSSEDKDFYKDATCSNGQFTPDGAAFRCSNGQTSYVTRRDDSWSSPDWRLALDYQFSGDLMGYISAATGFKSGGFNGRGGITRSATGVIVDSITVVDEEEVTSYEIGFKSTFADGRVRLNANYYFNDYTDLQLSAIDPAGNFFLRNAADVTIQGVELDLSAMLSDSFQVNANLGTIDGEYDSDPSVLVAPGSPTFPNELKQAPELTWSAGFIWDFDLASGGLSWSTSVHFTDEHYQNVANSELIKTESYTLIDTRLGYTPHEGNWEVALVGKNLSDEEYYTGGFDIGGLGIAAVYMNVPRQVGLEFAYRWE